MSRYLSYHSMQHIRRQPTLFGLIAGLASALAVVAVVFALDMVESRRHRETTRAHTLQQLATVRGNAESAINKRIYLTAGLKAYVSRNPDIDGEEFADVAGILSRESPGIRSLTLIKDNVINDVFPREGNEGAIGLELLAHPQQRHDVMRAIETGKSWLAGPITLAQGGEAFIDRAPVYVTEPGGPPGSGRYWGLVSILIDKETLISEIVRDSSQSTRLAVCSVTNEKRAYFVGDSSIEQDNPLVLEVALPSGRWEVLGMPAEGWATTSPTSAIGRPIGLMMAVLLGGMVFLLVRSGAIVHVARDDAARAAELRSEADEKLGATKADLAHRIRELEDARRASLNIMSDLRAANERLESVSREAENANAAKSEFLANMSHEIRTPMTAILGYSEVLIEEVSQSEQLANGSDAARTIHRNATILLDLINDILDLSKIEAGKLSIETTACAPTAIIADVKQLMSVRAEAKGIDLDIECDDSLPRMIQTDPTRLRQILVNLVGNAIKFTEYGSVRLVARYEQDQGRKLAFDVIDTGIGMSSEQIGNMFQPFTQADTSTTRRFGGTGLGLTISKRLAFLLKGDVSLVASAPGVGSTFRLALDHVVEIEANENERVDIGAAPITAASAKPVSLKGIALLLAEDGIDNQRLIGHILRKAGADVSVVENGQLAVETAMTAAECGTPFDVVLMDMQMPVLDGYGATKRLRELGYEGQVIALTAHAMAGDRDKCLAAGCNEFATKPIDRNRLIGLVKEVSENALVATACH